MKYCAAFPCKNYAEPGSAYCTEHRRPRAPKETDPFYLSVKWRRFRGWYLAQHPLCEMCEREGRGPVVAVMVHHRQAIKEGGALTDESNCESLCLRCHAETHTMTKNHQKCVKYNRNGSAKQTYLGARGRIDG